MKNKKTLICKEDLLNTVLDHFGIDLAYFGKDLQFCQEAIDMAPAIDAVEVVHGRWINQHWRNVCSECRYIVGQHSQSKYCPNCGAKMDGDGNG